MSLGFLLSVFLSQDYVLKQLASRSVGQMGYCWTDGQFAAMVSIYDETLTLKDGQLLSRQEKLDIVHLRTRLYLQGFLFQLFPLIFFIVTWLTNYSHLFIL